MPSFSTICPSWRATASEIFFGGGGICAALSQTICPPANSCVQHTSVIFCLIVSEELTMLFRIGAAPSCGGLPRARVEWLGIL